MAQQAKRLVNFHREGAELLRIEYGDDSTGDTPVPISNTEVKPRIADGTWLETAWESR